MKRLALLFDGTWNTPKSNTNVWRLKDSIAQVTAPTEQLIWYDDGVGTHWYDRLTGGVFGSGLVHNVLQGYRWLIDHYAVGDEIYLFGFSRGAYTARSLGGLIGKAGIIDPARHDPLETVFSLGRADALYRDTGIRRDDPAAQTFRQAHCYPDETTRLKCLGVWDTVGKLGIPVPCLPESQGYYRFLDTTLGVIVENAFQALALDEHRDAFAPTLWTGVAPKGTRVEQCWFPGAHANIGGGYAVPHPELLPNRPLRWMQERAASCGLNLRTACEPGLEDHLAPINDSLVEMQSEMGLLRNAMRFLPRTFGTGIAGTETLDDSVWWKAGHGGYTPSFGNPHDLPPTPDPLAVIPSKWPPI